MMTKLGATIESAEALDYASAMILRGHRRDTESSSFFEAGESRAFVSRFLRTLLLTVDGRLELLALARAGDGDAQGVLRDAILELKSRREPLPAEFDGYEMELIRGMVPQTGPGPDKRNELLRNICIAATVAAVCDRYGLRPTGRSARRRSGCAIVAQALGVIGKAISAKAVEAIWMRYRSAMPTAPGWTFALEDKALPS
jgi:hypothetical protein